MTEASYVIARLAQRYRTLRSVDWQAYREGFSITLSNDNGVQVVAESEHRA